MFFRILATNDTAVVNMQGDGSVTWTNASILGHVQVQRTMRKKWEDYIRIPATGATQTARLYDLAPPVGMVLIPAGSFVMGATTNVGHESVADETPQHTVYVGAYYMDQYEVTKALWDDVATWASTNGYDITIDGGEGKATNHPVEYISWHECLKWCNARSEMEGLNPCYTNSDGTVYMSGVFTGGWNRSANGYRLPTEAEWEKAARGGTAGHRYPWVDSDEIQHARANYYSFESCAYDTSATRGFHPDYATNPWPYTNPVGSFPNNGYELYDMAGNVSEWCWDLYSSNFYSSSSATNPVGPDTGSHRVWRGGCWIFNAFSASVACRDHEAPNSAVPYFGFRCARGISP